MLISPDDGIMNRPFIALIIVLPLLAACALQAPTGPGPAEALDPGDTPIVTDRTSYTLQRGSHGWETEIVFEYTNATERTISLLNCNGSFALRLEKLDAGEWVSAWGPPIPMCLSRPIEIARGDRYATTLSVFGGFPGTNTYPQFQVEPVDGTYRLVIESAYWGYDHDGPPWGEQVPLEERVSHTFEIRTP
jgi:hypothetical protein